MNRETAIKLFEHQRIRAEWDDTTQKWYFAIVDVIRVLTGCPKSRTYWSVLKTRRKNEGSQLATKCSQLTCTDLLSVEIDRFMYQASREGGI
jgi:hypothetical protein